ncbi:hypothetical protein DYB34_004540 [Aphanomyces astaci]|uniref:Uncharacterized protein n=1 Tax=Aphanomyces astaci TaxID=112090 RepID=A0A396ZUQ9_APHAT|nr:hypothetical protein DYB36_013131 [Aphanomyces astaci]RHY50009.1 hypothetical protein DYB34_004540 [Aphanomyces astaci]
MYQLKPNAVLGTGEGEPEQTDCRHQDARERIPPYSIPCDRERDRVEDKEAHEEVAEGHPMLQYVQGLMQLHHTPDRWTALLLLLAACLVLVLGTPPVKDDDPLLAEIRILRNDALKLKDKGSYEQSATKLDKAIRALQDLHESRTDAKKRAADASLLAQTLSELGNVLYADKQYVPAQRVLVQAVDLSKRIFGPSHPAYSLALRNLGEVYLALDQHEKAIESYKLLKSHAEKGLGKTHETVIESARRIGESYETLGKFKKAIKVYKNLLAELGLGETIPRKRAAAAHEAGVAEVYQGLASGLMKANQLDQALTYATVATKIFKRRDGANSITYAFSLNLLAGVNTYLGQDDAALSLLQDAQKIAVLVHGESHPLVSQGAHNIDKLQARMAKKKMKDEL